MSIWEEYFEKLNKYLLINVSQRLINLFIEEHRNLRERSMFHCYVMQELIQKNKKITFKSTNNWQSYICICFIL